MVQKMLKFISIDREMPVKRPAADHLRRIGFQVTICDRHDRAGGLLIYGIPGFKLEMDVVMRRNALLEAGGVKIVYNCEMSETISFTAIRDTHAAELIATGVYISRDIGGPGSGVGGIVQAIDYLYRRDCTNMPGSMREVMNAEEEGVEFVWLTAPKGFTGSEAVTGVKAARMRLGPPDSTGRQTPEPVPGSDYTQPCDLAIKALGFEPEDLVCLWNADGLEVTGWGTIKADFRAHATSIPGVYAAGDIVRGASLVVWAIRGGREAAEAIAERLNNATQVAAE